MTETWDESKPSGSRTPTLGDDDIREFKRSMRERLAEDHVFEATENPAFGAGGGYKIGKHKYLTLTQYDTAKTTDSDELAFRCKDISGNKELVLTPPSAGTDRQITKNSGANLNLNSGDFENYLIKAGFYDSGSIDGDDIAALAIKASNLDSGAVEQSKIADFAVGNSQLDSSCVTNEKITDETISLSKLVPEAAGDNNYFPDGPMGGDPFGATSQTSYQTGLVVRFSFPGTLRFYTGYYLSNGAVTGYYRILKNGTPILSWSLGGAGWSYRTDDISVVSGDYLTFQYYINNGSYSVNMRTTMRGLYRTAVFNHTEYTVT